MSGEWLEQSPDVLGVLGIHPPQELLGVRRGHRAQQVGGVVGVHRLEHVGGALGRQLPQHVGLLVLGQLLQNVGQPLVVEGVDHLVATLLGQFADRLGDLDCALPLELFEQLRHALVGHRQAGRRQTLDVLPVDDVHVAASAQPPRRPHRDLGHHPVACASRLDAQIDDEHVDPAQLRQVGIVDADPGFDHLASTSTSFGRWANLRSDTLPVVNVTAPGSIAVTRRIGTKILRRVSNSTTRPSTRGCWRTMLMLITTSRTRPRDSPSGPSTTIPASRAA